MIFPPLEKKPFGLNHLNEKFTEILVSFCHQNMSQFWWALDDFTMGEITATLPRDQSDGFVNWDSDHVTDDVLRYLCEFRWFHHRFRESFRVSTSQWETMLQCNVVSHWLGTSTDLSLHNVFWQRMPTQTISAPSKIDFRDGFQEKYIHETVTPWVGEWNSWLDTCPKMSE